MGVQIDSKEELYFLWYLRELSEAGYIKEIYWHEHTFLLLPEVKRMYKGKDLKRVNDTRRKVIDLSEGFKLEQKEKTFLPAHRYTPEAIVTWNDCAEGVFVSDFDQQDVVLSDKIPFVAQRRTLQIDIEQRTEGLISIFEVKPPFDKHNMTRLFKINRQFMYAVNGWYINLVMVKELMKNTFTPERYKMTDKMTKQRKISFKTTKLQDYVQRKK
jgi:hypothetical protein